MKLSAQAAFLIEYLDLPAATGVLTARWEPFQIEVLCADDPFLIVNKSRQVGFSFLVAAEAVAKRILTPRSMSLFQSINQAESAEKIRYVRSVIDALDSNVRPKLVVDNSLEIEFQNGSRIISQPCRPSRGKARADITLDEFAHYIGDEAIYTAAVPITSKGGKLAIGSSPMGAKGRFWEIFTESIRPYPNYRRILIPWWRVYALCTDVTVAESAAPMMQTAERVFRFGTPRLKTIFDALPIEAFRQEYECDFAVDAESWITWDEIILNQRFSEKQWYRYAASVEQAMAAIGELEAMVGRAVIEPDFVIGVDVGRRHDHTEIMLHGLHASGTMPLRINVSLNDVSFDLQERVLTEMMDRLHIDRCLIDETGIGMQFAERMHQRYPGIAEGVTFTAATKEAWATELRAKMQKGLVPIPMDRDLAYQLHSVRRKISGSNRIIFVVDAENEQHHADRFWAMALAVWAAGDADRRFITESENPLADYRG